MRLETTRLMIRELTAEDAADVHEYASNADVARYMIWGPNTEEETAQFIDRAIEMQRQQPRTGYEMAVVSKENGKLLGGCGIYIYAHLQGEIGYCFNPLYWGQGFASEAAKALLQFGFKDLGLHRIYATCRPENKGSAKVMEKIGMTYEGHLRGHMRHKDRWLDSFQYSILEHEFSGKVL
ncbi:N-acetyltransferase [Paenibacillus thalictri]|uniref:N-acetyltransferase n=2 Tax=Paenibacillus thalictri TaxID=2527873 RepID=A0A4Q9DWA9_9BACL|nr:GNAT family protein [Paenibacillus thalictri]TBL80008.1 N-acetyltransferase [Paenibacillus thalictri]